MAKSDPTLVHRKIAVLGFRAVGKTALCHSFVASGFTEAYDPTIENTHHKTVRFRRAHFSTDIVDTAGMDEYSRLSRNASVGVNGYVMVFSVASRQSFERIRFINGALLNALGDAPDVPRVLVGSMSDCAAQRQVGFQDAAALAELWGVPYIECSSKTGENISEVFHTLLKEVEKDDGLLVENDAPGCVIC